MAASWKVTRNYRAQIPGHGAPYLLALTGDTVVATDDLAEILHDRHWRVTVPPDTAGEESTARRATAADLIAWLNRDSPGLLEPSDAPATATPTRVVSEALRGVGVTP